MLERPFSGTKSKESLRKGNVTWIMALKLDLEVPEISTLATERVGTGGIITFPGGSIEPGETAREAAVREFWEETDLELDEDYLIPTHTNPVKVFTPTGEIVAAEPFYLFYDEAIPRHKKPKNTLPDKHKDWKWYTLAELNNLIIKAKLTPVLGPEWIDFILESIYEVKFVDENDYSPPASFMYECREIAYLTGLNDFKAKVLGFHGMTYFPRHKMHNF